MIKWMQYYLEREGLADLGNQEDMSHGDSSDELNIVRKAIKIAWEAGDSVRMKVVKFLKRVSRDLPQLHNLVSQLTDEDDDREDDAKHSPPPAGNYNNNNSVVTPTSDSSPQPGSGGE